MRNKNFDKLIEEVMKLHDKKNTDYATAEDPLKNLKGCIRLGLDPLKGVTVRLQDKWERIENFHKNGDLQNESVRDSYIDNAVYSLLAVLLFDEMTNKIED